MIKIRKAETQDIPEMIKILESAIHENFDGAGEYYFKEEYTDPNYKSFSGPYYSKKEFIKNNMSTLKERLKKPYEAFVLLGHDEFIGYIIIEQNKGRCWVNDLLIKKEHQQKGYGRKLYEHALKNKKEIYLWVNDANPAKKFWETLGFKTILKECLMKKN